MTGSGDSTAAGAPVTAAAFARRMAALGPFEPAPRLAVAVSGGADSLALAVLARDWVRDRGGTLAALTVDHGLRPEAAAEARQVGRILAGLGLAQRILQWRGPKPGANVQAAARAARYELLTAACRRAGVLHLLLAHHLDDQAETLLLRLGRGSGLDGLAAMAPIAELPELRLLRPLLDLPKARLVATLMRRKLPWIEDPSNADPAHARVRLRRLMPALAAEGLTAARLAAAAGSLGRARGALDLEVGRTLARTAWVHPSGHAELDPDALCAAPREVGLRALARLLTTVGGLAYPPRLARLERLYDRLAAGTLGRGATLGGCRLMAQRAPRPGRTGGSGGHARIVLVREAGRAESVAVGPGDRFRWDGRFAVAVSRRAPSGGLRLGPLGGPGWRAVKGRIDPAVSGPLPAAARLALPALSDARGVLAVPHLDYVRPGTAALTMLRCAFLPASRLTGSAFTVA